MDAAHSKLFGIMADGIPIFGPLGECVHTSSSASTLICPHLYVHSVSTVLYRIALLTSSSGDYGNLPGNLDECGGHADNTHPWYHYHVPNKRIFPYSLACLRGCVDETVWTNFAGIQVGAHPHIPPASTCAGNS